MPLVGPFDFQEEDEFTVWGTKWDRRGICFFKGSIFKILRDLYLDVLCVTDEMHVSHLEHAMKGIRAIGEMELAYDVYGHMSRQDGTVVGLVTEAAWGQPIKSSDRALIYQTTAQLQSRGCIYFGCLANHFLGKVRLIEPSSVHFYSKDDTERFCEEAEQFQ
jgi:hypothetical protein